MLPSRYDIDRPMSSATLNQVLICRLAEKEGQHLAYEQRGVRAGYREHFCLVEFELRNVRTVKELKKLFVKLNNSLKLTLL